MQPHKPLLSYSLVVSQFSLMGVILVTGYNFVMNLGLIIQLLGVFIGLWAVVAMKLGHFNIIPDLQPKATLVTRGPYRFIRHPMYAAILCVFIPLVLNDVSLLRLLVVALLILTLVIKLNYEESMLVQQLDGYADYQKKSHKLIPFVY